MDEELITIEQAIKETYCGLSFSYHQLRTAIINGELKAKKMANTWRVKKSWILDWLDTPDQIKPEEILYNVQDKTELIPTGGRKPNKLI